MMHILLAMTLLFAADAGTIGFDQTPHPVKFHNGRVQLSGVLLTPAGRGPFPAVVLVHGAGPATHDEPAFVVHANAFVRRGFAVLAYDKRGCGASSGTLDESDYSDLAADVAAGIRYLRSRPDIDAKRIGLLGRSEGGWVSMLAASHDRSIAFVIMSSGCAVTPAAEVRDWTRRSLAAKGFSRERIDDAVAAKAAIWNYYRDVLRGRATSDQRAAVVQRLAGFSDARPEVPAKIMDPAVDSRRKFVAFIHNIDFDPAPLLATLRTPLMEVIGSDDDVVEPKSTIAALERLRARGKDVAILTLPGVGHSLLVMDHGRIVGYPPNYLESILDFACRSVRGSCRTASDY